MARPLTLSSRQPPARGGLGARLWLLNDHHRALRPAFLAAALVATTALAACGSGSGDQAGGGDGEPAGKPASQAPRYYGMVASEALPQPKAEQEATMRKQAKAGVGLLRQTFQWNEIEPSKGRWAFGMHDQLVASAAKAGIELMPIVFNVRPDQKAAPKKNVTITATTTMPPKDPEAFAQYAATLVKRYGHGGTFWKEHPELPPHPPTAWQVWNEPNLKAYWGGRPNDEEYTELLDATSKAIRAADPQAEVVTGGVPESKLGIPLVDYVGLLVKDGAKGSFDTLAIHPYARDVDGVMLAVSDARQILDDAGLEDVNLWITEVGWATGSVGSEFTVSERRQAQLVAELLQRTANVAPQLRLHGVVYYGWRDVQPPPGVEDFWGWHTGLLKEDGTAKPALASYTRWAHELRSGNAPAR